MALAGLLALVIGGSALWGYFSIWRPGRAAAAEFQAASDTYKRIDSPPGERKDLVVDMRRYEVFCSVVEAMVPAGSIYHAQWMRAKPRLKTRPPRSMAATMAVGKALSELALAHAVTLERSRFGLDDYSRYAALTKELLVERVRCPDARLNSLRAGLVSQHVHDGREAITVMFDELLEGAHGKREWSTGDVNAMCQLLGRKAEQWGEQEALVLEMTPLFREVRRSEGRRSRRTPAVQKSGE